MLFYFFAAGACAWLIPVALITSTFYIEQPCGAEMSSSEAGGGGTTSSSSNSPEQATTFSFWYTGVACKMLPTIYTFICVVCMAISIISSRRIARFTRGIRRIYRSVSPTTTLGCKILNNPTDTATTKGVIYSIPFALCQIIALIALILVAARAMKSIDDTVVFTTTVCIAVFGGFIAGGFQSIVCSVVNMFEGTSPNVVYYTGFWGMGALMMIGSPTVNIVSWFALAVFVIVMYCIIAVLFYYSKEHQCAVPTFNRLKQMKKTLKQQDLISALNICHSKTEINTLYSTPVVAATLAPSTASIVYSSISPNGKLAAIPEESTAEAAAADELSSASGEGTRPATECSLPVLTTLFPPLTAANNTTDTAVDIDVEVAVPTHDWSVNTVAKIITIIQFFNGVFTFAIFPSVTPFAVAINSTTQTFDFLACFFITPFIAIIVLFLIPGHFKTKRRAIIFIIVLACLRCLATGAFFVVYMFVPNFSVALVVTALHLLFHSVSYWACERCMGMMRCARKTSISIVNTHGALIVGLLANCIGTILTIFYK